MASFSANEFAALASFADSPLICSDRYLADNPLQCDCAAHKTLSLFAESASRILDAPTCASPTSRRGTVFQDAAKLSEEALCGEHFQCIQQSFAIVCYRRLAWSDNSVVNKSIAYWRACAPLLLHHHTQNKLCTADSILVLLHHTVAGSVALLTSAGPTAPLYCAKVVTVLVVMAKLNRSSMLCQKLQAKLGVLCIH